MTPMNFLIVDDLSENRRAVMESLAWSGAAFHEARTGEEAVALYAETKPDWVIMDFVMPGIGGLVAAQQIKAKDPAARIVLLTCHDNEQAAEAARRAGALGVLGKEDFTAVGAALALFSDCQTDREQNSELRLAK